MMPSKEIEGKPQRFDDDDDDDVDRRQGNQALLGRRRWKFTSNRAKTSFCCCRTRNWTSGSKVLGWSRNISVS